MGFGHQQPAHLAYRRSFALHVINQDVTINIGSLGRHAGLPEEVGVGGRPFHQNGNFLAAIQLVTLFRDPALDRHQLALAIVDIASPHLAVQFKTLAGVFVGVGEDAHIVELRLFHKLAQGLEIFLCLAREADNKAGPNRHARNRPADLLQ